jgi:hypothetical protein
VVTLQKKARGGDKESVAQLALIEAILPALQAGKLRAHRRAEGRGGGCQPPRPHDHQARALRLQRG